VQSVVTKKEREESLLGYLHSLGHLLPLVQFYKETFPTDRMKLAVAKIYAGVMKLLDEALVYYRSGRLGWNRLHGCWCYMWLIFARETHRCGSAAYEQQVCFVHCKY
jgi:hypothetical protein